MSERYTRLFSLPENIGQDGCPVLISAGALLKDNNTGKVLVQLKLRNISEQVIRSVRVKINAYDTAGIALKGIDTFSYLDLTVERDGEFGSKTPIVLPDKTTRSVSVEILSVVYGHGEIYQPRNNTVAKFVDDKTVEKIQSLNNERYKHQIAIQQDRKRRLLFLLSFLPLALDVLAIALYGFYIGRLGKFLISLIIPCLCIWSSRKISSKPLWAKIAVCVSLVFLGFQVLSGIYLQYGAYHNINPVFYHFISDYIAGSNFIYYFTFFIELYHFKEFSSFYKENLPIELIFIAKNLCAVIILFLQMKNNQKETSHRREKV